MQLEAKKYLYDMQQAAALLTNFTSGKSFEDHTNDPMQSGDRTPVRDHWRGADEAFEA